MRAEAVALSRALDAAERAVAGGLHESVAILDLVGREIAKAPHASVGYAELRDPASLEPAPARLAGPTLLALAVRFPARGAADPSACVRLIDNRVLVPQGAEDAASGAEDPS
jgi:pantothenate synthetase